MPENKVHDQLGQLQPGTLGLGQYKAEREQKAKIFRAQYPERYTGGTKKGAPYDIRHDA